LVAATVELEDNHTQTFFQENVGSNYGRIGK